MNSHDLPVSRFYESNPNWTVPVSPLFRRKDRNALCKARSAVGAFTERDARPVAPFVHVSGNCLTARVLSAVYEPVQDHPVRLEIVTTLFRSGFKVASAERASPRAVCPDPPIGTEQPAASRMKQIATPLINSTFRELILFPLTRYRLTSARKPLPIYGFFLILLPFLSSKF